MSYHSDRTLTDRDRQMERHMDRAYTASFGFLPAKTCFCQTWFKPKKTKCQYSSTFSTKIKVFLLMPLCSMNVTNSRRAAFKAEKTVLPYSIWCKYSICCYNSVYLSQWWYLSKWLRYHQINFFHHLESPLHTYLLFHIIKYCHYVKVNQLSCILHLMYCTNQHICGETTNLIWMAEPITINVILVLMRPLRHFHNRIEFPLASDTNKNKQFMTINKDFSVISTKHLPSTVNWKKKII